MHISLNLVSGVLLVKYINFKLFDQATNDALAETIRTILEIAVLIPIQNILACKKLKKKYFHLMWVLFTKRILVLILLCKTETLITIVDSLKAGLSDVDADISSKCANAIDGLATFNFNAITIAHTIPPPGAVELHRHFISSQELPELVDEILKTLFEIVLFEDGGNDWKFSHPILSLLGTSNMIMDMKSHFLHSQPTDCSNRLTMDFNYIENIVNNCNLDGMTQDNFCELLFQFRHTILVI
ncbi:hypothetical protein SASPL_125133 [Salvia splendens]|uniref:Uncharacterized protein n=1 Tax=Salvia splendens TaxID=180675 RepID=A0A8X8ZQH1_SALSN|nr:hypothetical protein SASPL_125133 [Salvia splendens]